MAFDLASAKPIDEAFNTALSPDEEAQFGEWKSKNAPNDSGADYDLRGAFKAGLTPAGPEAGVNEGHWPDTFKKPNHPTFSVESKYAKFGNPGRWEGNNFIPGTGGFDLASAKPAGEALGPKDVPDMPEKQAPAAEQPKLPLPLDLLARGGRKVAGDLDAAASIASSIPAQLIGRGVAVAHGLFGGKYGTQEGAGEAQAAGAKVANALTPDVSSNAGQEAMDQFSKMVDASKIEGAGPMMPEVSGPAGGPLVMAGREVPANVVAAGKAGLKITPDEAGAGAVGRTAAGLSGEAKLAKGVSNENQAPLIQKISKDLELPKDTVLDREATEAVREKQGQAYEVVRKTGKVTADDAFRTDLEAAAKDVRTAAEDFDHRKASPILKIVDSLLEKDTFDANSAVSEIKNLRKDAKKAFRTGDEELGIGSLDVASALEGVLDRHIEKLSTSNEYGGLQIAPDAMNALKKARVIIAKSYAADKALRGTEINPQVYARMLENRVPLTGGSKEVAEFARDFPRSSQKPSHMPTKGPDWSDVIMALASGGKSIVKTAGLSALRPAGRAVLASDAYQALQRSHPSAAVPVPGPNAVGILGPAAMVGNSKRREVMQKRGD